MLNIHSPSELIASIQPSNQKNFLLSNADLQADFESPVRDSDDAHQRRSLYEIPSLATPRDGQTKLRHQANSSNLSKDSANNDAILKPVIHLAAPVRHSGQYGETDGCAEEIGLPSGDGRVWHQQIFTEGETASNMCLEATLRKDRNSKVQTKLLMSDKTTLRMNETEQSQVSMVARNHMLPSKHESQQNVVAHHLRVTTGQQTTSSFEVERVSAFNASMRRDTLRKNMVDKDTSPRQENVNFQAQPRRLKANIDVVASMQPSSPIQPPTALASEHNNNSPDNSQSPVSIKKKRNGPLFANHGNLTISSQKQCTNQQPRSMHKLTVISVKFEEEDGKKKFSNAYEAFTSPMASSNGRLLPSDGNLNSARGLKSAARGSTISNSRKDHQASITSPNSSQMGRVRPKPLLSPSRMLQAQFKPILQEDVDPSPLKSASRKLRTKSINSPASQQDVSALLKNSEFGEAACASLRGGQASPDHQISCKLLPMETMAREPTIKTKTKSKAHISSIAVKSSKSASNSAAVHQQQNFQQIKQRQIELEAPLYRHHNDAKNVFKLKYQKQHARAAEKIKLNTKSKTQPVKKVLQNQQHFLDQQAQTSQPTIRLESPYKTYDSMLPVPPHYGEVELGELACDENDVSHYRASSTSNKNLQSFQTNTYPPRDSVTPNEEELYQQIAMDMIDRDSKIIVVCRESGSSANQNSNLPIPKQRIIKQDSNVCRASNHLLKFPNQVSRYRGNKIELQNAQRRRKLNKQRYTTENQLKLAQGAGSYQNDDGLPHESQQHQNSGFHMMHKSMPMSARANSTSLRYATMREFKAQPQVMSMASRSGLKSRGLDQSRYTATQRYSYQKTAAHIREQTSSPSVLSRQTNTLSQVLGIQSRLQSPKDKNGRTLGDKEPDRTNQSVMQHQTIPEGITTLTRVQAKEFHAMRSRIKSQGAPRRRFINQRQNLYNLMASGLKKQGGQQPKNIFSQELGPTTEQEARQLVASQQQNEREVENPVTAVSTQHSPRGQTQQTSVEATEEKSKPVHELKMTSSGYQASENNQFIAYEDQLDSMLAPAGPSPEPTITDATPRFHYAQLSQATSNIASISKTHDSKQRMDLPHNMSVQQAVFMMSKTQKSLLLKKHDQFHRLHTRRNQAGRICSTVRNQSRQEPVKRDFISDVAMKETRTSLEYSGAISTEPKFQTKCKQKTAADYARSSACMQLRIPPERGLSYVKENDFTFDRNRQVKIHEDTLANADESFAMIQSHVSRLRNRQQSPHKKSINLIDHARKVHKIDSGSLKSDQSPIKVEYLITADNSSYQTLHVPEQPAQNLEIQYSQETPADGSQSQRPSSPQRKLIQIVRVNAQNGVTTDGPRRRDTEADPTAMITLGAGGFERLEQATLGVLDGQRMSTKLLPAESGMQMKNRVSENPTSQQESHDGGAGYPHGAINNRAKSHKGKNMQIVNCKTEVSNSQTTIKRISNADLPVQEGEFVVNDQNHLQLTQSRQALSPQPVDRSSKLIQPQGQRVAERGFITIRQDYCVKEPSSQGGRNRLATNNSHHAASNALSNEGGIKIISVANNASHVAKQGVVQQTISSHFRIKSQRTSESKEASAARVSRQRLIPSRQLQAEDFTKPVIRLTSSTSGILNDSQDRLNPVPKLTQTAQINGAVIQRRTAAASRRSRRPQQLQNNTISPRNQSTVRRNNVRDQSMSISGIKMFNPELSANSGGVGGTTHHKIEVLQHFSQGDDIFGKNRFIDIPATMPPHSTDQTPELENDQHSQGGLLVKMMQDVNSIASRNNNNDYDDHISTEKKYISTDQKSSLLVRSRVTVNKSQTARTSQFALKGPKDSDPAIHDMLLEKNDSQTNKKKKYAVGSPERAANLTPPVPEFQTKL